MPATKETLSLEKIETLNDFLEAIIELLKVIGEASPVLFRLQFQINYRNCLEEILSELERLKKDIDQADEDMYLSGLYGKQLQLKLESFEYSYMDLKKEGGLDNVENVLDKGSTILNSLAGAIPGFGSFAQEFVDFIIKELKQRFKFWKR